VLALPFIPQIAGETTYFTSFAANFIFKNNLHEIVPGRFFRSGQMNPADLTQTMKEHNIKTVIDLRLAVDDSDAEQGISEKQVVENAGGQYSHIPFSSARADQKEQIEKLLDTFEEAQTPILVHCSSGTHRSGIASALWLLEKEGKSVETAEDQISIRYGFFQFERDLKAFFQGKPTLDEVLREYAKANNAERISFREWLKNQDQLSSEPKQTPLKEE
jgi:uncharacterized protein (TIGR01244 family)